MDAAACRAGAFCAALLSIVRKNRPTADHIKVRVRSRIPLLGEGGEAAPSRKISRRHLIRRGRGGSFKPPIIFLTNTTPSAPTKEASRHFLDGVTTPPRL